MISNFTPALRCLIGFVDFLPHAVSHVRDHGKHDEQESNKLRDLANGPNDHRLFDLPLRHFDPTENEDDDGSHTGNEREQNADASEILLIAAERLWISTSTKQTSETMMLTASVRIATTLRRDKTGIRLLLAVEENKKSAELESQKERPPCRSNTTVESR